MQRYKLSSYSPSNLAQSIHPLLFSGQSLKLKLYLFIYLLFFCFQLEAQPTKNMEKNIPEYLIVEILSKFPAKSLLRLMSVHTSWYTH